MSRKLILSQMETMNCNLNLIVNWQKVSRDNSLKKRYRLNSSLKYYYSRKFKKFKHQRRRDQNQGNKKLNKAINIQINLSYKSKQGKNQCPRPKKSQINRFQLFKRTKLNRLNRNKSNLSMKFTMLMKIKIKRLSKLDRKLLKKNLFSRLLMNKLDNLINLWEKLLNLKANRK